jgi:hypothetical protein
MLHGFKQQVNIFMENTLNIDTQITIADLDLCKKIIDLASSRGAFQGAELKTVGEVYEKLSAFLNSAMAQANAQEEQEKSSTEQDKPQGE